MYIIPFIYKKNKLLNNLEIHTIHLISQGNQLWEEADNTNIDIDIIEGNDFVLLSAYRQYGNIIFIPLNPDKTNMDDMYIWNEVEPNTELLCWKKFSVIYSNNKLWLPAPDKETNDVLEMIINTPA
jgi:hypothetical protein